MKRYLTIAILELSTAALCLVASPAIGLAEEFTCLDGNRAVQTKIVGGNVAKAGDWEWQVQVFPQGALCGGSLVHPEWVLTAAHCLVDDGNEAYAPGGIEVVGGTQRLDEGGVRRRVSRVVVHPNYDGDASHGYDLGLLRLEAPMEADSLSIVRLQSPTLERTFGYPGSCAVTTGWGTTRSGGQVSKDLRYVDVPLWDNEKCKKVYPEIQPSMVCAGWPQGGKDSCQGDSGGPLVTQGGPTGWTLVGIVSYGQGCADPGVPGVYTRVSHYIDWIQEVTK